MKNVPLSLATLGSLDDGTIRRLIDTALEEALQDCDNRPGLEKARKVTITVEFVPVLSDRGGMKGVQNEVQVKTSVPPRAGRSEYLPTSVHGDTVTAHLPDNYEQPMFGQEDMS